MFIFDILLIIFIFNLIAVLIHERLGYFKHLTLENKLTLFLHGSAWTICILISIILFKFNLKEFRKYLDNAFRETFKIKEI